MPMPAGEPTGRQPLEICATDMDRLDALHVHDWLGVENCLSLFKENADLLAVTSAVRYPVFVNRKNYRGNDGDGLIRHPVLRPFVDNLFAPCSRARERSAALWRAGAQGED